MGTVFKGIKTAAEYQRGELAHDVLRLVGAGVAMGAVIVAPNMAQVIDYFNPKGQAERRRIWRTIKYLEEKNRVKIEERDGDQYIHLTVSGRKKLTENTVWELTVDKPYRWDSKWRMVMFDLPARHNKVRNVFRLKLEDLGFVQYQRSVFIYPYECHKEVHTVAKWYGIDDYVRYIVATEVHDMRRFVKLFDLL